MDPDDEDVVIGEARKEKQTLQISQPGGLMAQPGSLPQFSYCGFVDEIGKERRKDEERQRAKGRRDMWTTPAQRPLTEPPIMDWDYIFRVHIPSDAQYAALFPDDPERRCRQKDLDGEGMNLYQYSEWLRVMAKDKETDASRSDFYRTLELEVQEEYAQVRRERNSNALWASSLSRFEYAYLDRDGGTKRLQEWMGRGADVFRYSGQEVVHKYGHLLPPHFKVDDVATWEFHHLDSDGGAEELRRILLTGRTDPFWGWPSKIREKYAYIIPPDSKLRRRNYHGHTEIDDEETKGASQASAAGKGDTEASIDEGTRSNGHEPRSNEGRQTQIS